MNFLSVRRRSIACLVAAVAVLGCGKGNVGPETVPVAGKVTLGGEPVAQATVTLSPTAGSASAAPAQAVTNDAGEFEVYSTFDQGRTTQVGMTPGDYAVTVTKLETLPAQAQLTRAPKNLLPKRYETPDSSDLKAVIALEGENFVALELKK